MLISTAGSAEVLDQATQLYFKYDSPRQKYLGDFGGTAIFCKQKCDGIPLDIDADGYIDTLPKASKSHLKINGWKINFLLGWPIFRGYVSFREGSCFFVKDIWGKRTSLIQFYISKTIPKMNINNHHTPSCQWNWGALTNPNLLGLAWCIKLKKVGLEDRA